jgi:HAD superfamily hydrolase (TIGR01457 family)
MGKLKDVKCFLLDMDGTFYLGDKLINGALDFLDVLSKNNKSFLFITNNSSKNKFAYKQKLNKLGCKVSEENIFTSGEGTIIYLKRKKEGAKVFLLGTPYLEDEFRRAGFKLIKDNSEIPDFVVLGFDTTLTYEKVWMACDFIREGIKFIATHPDINCPLENGKFMPDAGAMIKMIEASTGKSPLIIGKPNKYIIETVMDKYNLKKEELAIVGDRLYTDIKLGENTGITSVLVLSGETSLKCYEKSQIKADYVFPSIKELAEYIMY